jgi:hypothetical protein
MRPCLLLAPRAFRALANETVVIVDGTHQPSRLGHRRHQVLGDPRCHATNVPCTATDSRYWWRGDASGRAAARGSRLRAGARAAGSGPCGETGYDALLMSGMARVDAREQDGPTSTGS